MNWREILWLILIGVLIALSSFCGVQSCRRQKVIENYNLKLKACLNAPKTVDTVHDTLYYYDTTFIKLKGKDIIIHDTTIKWCQSFFDSTYKFTNTFGSGRIHYRIDVRDCQASIQFPEVVSPKEVITITNTVDTCLLKPPEYKAKLFHWGLYADLTAHDFKVFPGVGAGGQLIFKDQVTIGAGALYMDKWYGNVRIGVLFK